MGGTELKSSNVIFIFTLAIFLRWSFFFSGSRLLTSIRESSPKCNGNRVRFDLRLMERKPNNLIIIL